MILSPPMKTMIEAFNTDIATAVENGLSTAERVALAGAICESVIESLPEPLRPIALHAIIHGLRKRFP